VRHIRRALTDDGRGTSNSFGVPFERGPEDLIVEERELITYGETTWEVSWEYLNDADVPVDITIHGFVRTGWRIVDDKTCNPGVAASSSEWIDGGQVSHGKIFS